MHALERHGESPCCEMDLLIRSSLQLLRSCDIKILRSHKTQWTWLEETKTRLFSTAEETPLHVVCDNSESFTINIKSTGLLKLHHHCQAETSTDVLRNAGATKYHLPELHVAPLNLNLSEISPNLTKPYQIPTLLKTMKMDPLPNSSHASDLHTFEHTLDLVANHKMEEFNRDNFHLGVTGITAIVVLIIVTTMLV
uniref:Uncharacterized protein n=1 Tax=Bracon brevicornis TaxID=1563983 RepID=A0A6V7L3Q8_9HYME